MHTLCKNVDTQRAREVAAQRSGAPELVVVATLGVQADDEIKRTDSVL
jgi:hypothetical protein